MKSVCVWLATLPALCLACGSANGDRLFSESAGNDSQASSTAGSAGSTPPENGGSGGTVDRTPAGGAPNLPSGGAPPSSGGTPPATGGAPAPNAGGMAGSSPGTTAGTGGMPTPRPEGAGTVRCGSTECDLSAGEVCCVVPPLMDPTDPLAVQVSCTSRPEQCAAVFSCDADSDCENGHCCLFETMLPFGGVVSNAECRDSCGESGSFACNRPADCERDRVCCGRTVPTNSFSGSRYEDIRCETGCNDNDEFIQCDTQDDCVSGGSCSQSRILPPGYTACLQ